MDRSAEFVDFGRANYNEIRGVDNIKPVGVHHLFIALAEIFHENEYLKRKIEQLEKAKKISSKDLDSEGLSMQPAETLYVPREKMVEIIKKYFEDHHGESIYPSDLAEEFGFSYLSVQSIIDELEQKGMIRGC